MARELPSTSNPVQQLIDEHVIFMDALEELAAVMASVDDNDTRLSEDVLAAVRRYWGTINEHLNVHFVKEEEIFFPFIERLFSNARIKFQFLHIDHDKLRDRFEELTVALQDHGRPTREVWRAGRLKKATREMIRLLYYHIVAEDTIYLEIAEQKLAPEEARQVLAQMKALEDRLLERTYPSVQYRIPTHDEGGS